MSDSVAGAAGVIGGWSPASVPREDARILLLIGGVPTDPTDPSGLSSPWVSSPNTRRAISPRPPGWFLETATAPLRSNPGGYAVDSVRGYEMNPWMYSRSAVCIALCAPMPIPADAALSISTVLSPAGGALVRVSTSTRVVRAVPALATEERYIAATRSSKTRPRVHVSERVALERVALP